MVVPKRILRIAARRLLWGQAVKSPDSHPRVLVEETLQVLLNRSVGCRPRQPNEHAYVSFDVVSCDWTSTQDTGVVQGGD
jgi:hypothetical protein